MKLGVFISDFKYDAELFDRIASDETGVFLVHDGVYNAVVKENGKPSPLLEKVSKIFVLKDDLKLRGFAEDAVPSNVEVVDYGDIVDKLMEEYKRAIWL
jgi:sulfur relay protein TusB/DsrH